MFRNLRLRASGNFLRADHVDKISTGGLVGGLCDPDTGVGSFLRSLKTKAEAEVSRSSMASKPSKNQHSQQRLSPYTFSLPRLPVPPLQQTLDKYFTTLKPLLSEGELKHTDKLLKEFGKPGGEGETLQNLLEKRAEEHVNWMEDWWLRKGYLEFRPPLPVNVSPGIVFPCQHYSDLEGQLRTAASFVTHILQFRELINSGQLEPDTMKGKPVCMSQYLKIFGSYRVPGNTHDEIIVGGENTERPYVIVMHNQAIFQVPVHSESGEPLSQHGLYLHLHHVVSEARGGHAALPFGILTSEDRSSWSHAYKALHKSKLNRHLLELIQQSLFVLCLDSESTNDENQQKSGSSLTKAARQILTGDGSKANSGNRWFDKTLQLIVGSNGVCGWNYEHTLIEGPPLFRMMEYIVKQTGNLTSSTHSTSDSAGMRLRKHSNLNTSIKRITFQPDADMVSQINTAAEQMDTLVNDLDLQVMEFSEYGKEFIKSRQLSPDSYFQMAIQLAYYRLYNNLPPTYESASARQFARGRTETIRSASVESLDFVQAMVKHADPKTTRKLLSQAVDAHKKYGAEASSGHGVDRHLFGLKMSAVENGFNIPAFLMDVGYTTSTHWELSTSQGNSIIPAFMCYGPAVADGYGCCYNPMKDRILAGISATNSYTGTNSRRFAETVADSLMDMKKILE